MDVDDYTQPLESVMRQEQLAMYPVPLKLQDRQELFKLWCELNPRVLRQIELTALAKYLIEKQRYEGSVKLVGVPFVDGNGVEHVYGINNTDTPLLARWLLKRHPKLNIKLRNSIYDKENNHEA